MFFTPHYYYMHCSIHSRNNNYYYYSLLLYSRKTHRNARVSMAKIYNNNNNAVTFSLSREPGLRV